MEEYWTVLRAAIPVFGIAVAGLAMRKMCWLTAEADQSLLRVNINLLFPCLILDSALGNAALSRLSNLVLAPIVGFGTVAVGLALALGMRRLHGLSEPKARHTFAFTTGIYNYSYVPVPLALLLFPGNETVGASFMHNVGVETAMWTLGVMLLTGRGVGHDWRKILNPPLIAILVALLLNLCHWNAAVPGVITTAIHWLGQCAIPMSLILIGAVVADYLDDFHSSWGWRVIASAVAIRILALPLLFLCLAKHLPASTELKRVIVLQAAMPSAVFPIVMARHYGGDPLTALRVVIGTSVVGLVTIPLWIRLGLKFVGL